MATVVSHPAQSRVTLPATKLLINGHWVKSVSGKRFKTVNPRPARRFRKVAEADAADVDLAVKAARAAFDSKAPWRTNVRRRARPAAQPARRPDREECRRTGQARIAGQRQAILTSPKPPTCR